MEEQCSWPIRGLAEVRADGERPKLVGYASVFNSRSEDLGGMVEIVRPGAFKRSLREKPDVRALVEHDARSIIGRRGVNLDLVEDDRGLKVEIVPPDTQPGRDLVANVRAGILDGMSFSFMAVRQEWDHSSVPSVRSLLDVDLFEVSVVAWPAYPRTEIALRALAAALAEAARATDSSSATVGRLRRRLDRLSRLR